MRQLAEVGLPLNMELKSKQLAWPFQAARKQFQADNVQLKFSGQMTDYALAFSTGGERSIACRRRKSPSTPKAMNGRSTLDKLTVNALEGKTEAGRRCSTGSRRSAGAASLTLDGINTAKEVPDWPSKLNGRIKTQGSLYGGSWQMSVPELKITGNVKQNKVDVAGSLQGNSAICSGKSRTASGVRPEQR